MDEVKKILDYFCRDQDWNNDYFLQVYEESLNLTYWLKGFEPHNILEIGARGTNFFILSKFSTGKKVALDLSPLENRMHMAMYGQDWKFFTGNSHMQETFNEISDFCQEFDLIYIDGDHSYDGVKKDFEMYKGLLSKRGVILFHDIDPNHVFPGEAGGGEVAKFWNDLSVGTKTNLVTTKSSGKNKLWGRSEGFGGIGIWTP